MDNLFLNQPLSLISASQNSILSGFQGFRIAILIHECISNNIYFYEQNKVAVISVFVILK